MLIGFPRDEEETQRPDPIERLIGSSQAPQFVAIVGNLKVAAINDPISPATASGPSGKPTV
jgi:hypothetical protein